MFPSCVISSVFLRHVPAVLSTRQIPFVLLRSRKTPVSPGTGYRPGDAISCYLLICSRGVIYILSEKLLALRFALARGSNLFGFAEFFFIIRLVRDKRSKVYFNLAPAVSIRYSVHQTESCLVSVIYAILLSINPPNAKIHQINATATISLRTIPTLVLD